MKITILGYSGAGKSTLARQLGKVYDIPVLHLDTVQFLPNWQDRPVEEGKQIVSDFMQKDSWIIEGNYRRFFQVERLMQADKVILLLFNRFVCFKRVNKRKKMFNGTNRPDMADGCAEKVDFEFAMWVLFKGRTKQRRKHYKTIAKTYSSKTTIIKNAKQVDEFIKQLQ